jgi:hypothetical protein
MFDPKIFTRFERTIGQKTITVLQDLSVLKNDDGSYCLFNKYTIMRVGDMYEVTGDSIINKLLFYTLKNAVAWCTFDKRVVMHACKRILELDRNLACIDTDIAQHQRMAKSAKSPDDELIYLAKLGEDKLKRKRMLGELGSYVQDSRNWQLNRLSAKP